MARRALAVALVLLSSGCSDVSGPTIDRVAFDRHAATLLSGDVLPTSVAVTLTNGEAAASPPVTYASSDPLVASVDSTGTVRAHAAGRATITAAVGPIADRLEVTVLWPPVKVLVFQDDSLSLFVGDTVAPDVIVLDSRGNWATHATMTFSSSSATVATVNPEGSLAAPARIAAAAEGRALVTVRADGVSDVLTVKVARR